MSPATNDEISTGKELDVRTVKIADIMDCADEEVGKNGEVFKYPYMIEITEAKEDGRTISARRTTKTMKTENWNKKFYIKKTENEKTGQEFKNVRYTKNDDLLAIVTILAKAGDIKLPKQGVTFSVNDLIGKEFEAVIIEFGELIFIDWVNTFDQYDIPTPTVAELEVGKPIAQSVEAKEQGSTISVDDLPF